MKEQRETRSLTIPRSVCDAALFLAASALLYFFAEAFIGIVKGSVKTADLSLPAKIGIALGVTVTACFLLLLTIRVITQAFFSHLLIEDPLGAVRRKRQGQKLSQFELAKISRNITRLFGQEPASLPDFQSILQNLESSKPTAMNCAVEALEALLISRQKPTKYTEEHQELLLFVSEQKQWLKSLARI